MARLGRMLWFDRSGLKDDYVIASHNCTDTLRWFVNLNLNDRLIFNYGLNLYLGSNTFNIESASRSSFESDLFGNQLKCLITLFLF